MHSPAPTGASGPSYLETVLLVGSVVLAILPAPTPPGEPALPPLTGKRDESVVDTFYELALRDVQIVVLPIVTHDIAGVSAVKLPTISVAYSVSLSVS